MATDSSISNLPPTAAILATQEVGLNNSGVTEKGTFAQIKTFVNAVSKSVFFAADYSANLFDYRVRAIGGAGTFRFSFHIPSDFQSLNSLQLIGAPTAGAAGAGKDIDLTSSYGAIGENAANHSESDLGTLYNTGTTDVWFGIDLSVVFSTLSASDFCGVMADHNSIGGSINYVGIVLNYD